MVAMHAAAIAMDVTAPSTAIATGAVTMDSQLSDAGRRRVESLRLGCGDRRRVGAGDAAAISSLPLGLIQRVIRPPDQRGDTELPGTGRSDADAHRDRDGLAARDHRE